MRPGRLRIVLVNPNSSAATTAAMAAIAAEAAGDSVEIVVVTAPRGRLDHDGAGPRSRGRHGGVDVGP